MPATIHTINRELFEFECLKTEHAFEIRNRFNDDIREKLSGIINKACNEINDEDTVITIPTLEVDLGMICFNNLEEEILWCFEKNFLERISAFKNSNRPGVRSEFSKSELPFEVLKYYLLTGHLPWFASKQNEAYLENIFEEIFTQGKQALQNFILSNLNNDRFIERLASQISPDYFGWIISLVGLDADSVSAFKKIISDVLVKFIVFLKTESKRSDSSIMKILNEKDEGWKKESSDLILIRLENIERNYNHQQERLLLELVLKLIAEKNDSAISERFYVLLKKLLFDKIGNAPATFQFFLVEHTKTVQELEVRINDIKDLLQKNKVINEESQEKPAVITESKFYLSNSGLILIANYLPAFFDQLKLIKNGNFLDKRSQLKAVSLLYFLGTGKEAIVEYIVPLNKILCGLPLDEPLPQELLLTGEDKSECFDLLNAIIENWKKIGNITIEGFSEAFINRDGILTYENNQWMLKVERKGYDILLESLPWSFNYTKLSWMQDLIVTEW